MLQNLFNSSFLIRSFWLVYLTCFLASTKFSIDPRVPHLIQLQQCHHRAVVDVRYLVVTPTLFLHLQFYLRDSEQISASHSRHAFPESAVLTDTTFELLHQLWVVRE